MLLQKASEIYDMYAVLKKRVNENKGSIAFRCPNEVYAVSFESYLTGGITIDEFISEADRKHSAYLNE